MHQIIGTLIAACLAFAISVMAGPASADEEGDFDYWILSLSWSPEWCSREGDAAGGTAADRQCATGAGLGFVVHGLWPQYEEGWPEFCHTDAPPPSRRDSAAMADLMPSGDLAYYQWRKHGRCSGLSGQDYYAMTRKAAGAVQLPAILQQIDRAFRLPVTVIEDAFIEANPDMHPDGITVTCRSDVLHEVRICLDRDLSPRRCAPDAARDCSRPNLLVEPPR